MPVSVRLDWADAMIIDRPRVTIVRMRLRQRPISARVVRVPKGRQSGRRRLLGRAVLEIHHRRARSGWEKSLAS